MPIIESRPLGQTPEALPTTEGRVVERNFDILSTHIEGFFLLVEHGADPDLLRSQTRTLSDTINVYGARAELIKHLLELQEEPHKVLEDFGINIPRLRGGRDTRTGNEVQINPKTTDIFDEKLLDESLGERKGEFVHGKIIVTIELDPDKDDVEGFLASVKRRLKRQGLSNEEIEKRLKSKTTLRVDEKALQLLIESGEVTLLPGAWNIKTNRWDIVPRRIPTTRELEEAEESTRDPQ